MSHLSEINDIPGQGFDEEIIIDLIIFPLNDIRFKSDFAWKFVFITN